MAKFCPKSAYPDLLPMVKPTSSLRVRPWLALMFGLLSELGPLGLTEVGRETRLKTQSLIDQGIRAARLFSTRSLQMILRLAKLSELSVAHAQAIVDAGGLGGQREGACERLDGPLVLAALHRELSQQDERRRARAVEVSGLFEQALRCLKLTLVEPQAGQAEQGRELVGSDRQRALEV